MVKPTLDEAVADEPKSLLEELQSSLFGRFSRVLRKSEPVVYEFTNDRALLHQYYRIREIMYRKVHNTTKFDGKEDLHDKIAHILIARRGNLVIGGCRLIVREGDEDFLLPMEDDHFKIRDVFSNLPLTKLRHGEISRFAILDEDDEHLDIMFIMSKMIIDKCKNLGLAYAFLKAPGAIMARNWRKITQVYCGVKRARICSEIMIPENPDYPEIEWRIVELPLPASEITPATAKASTDELFAMPTQSLVQH